MATKLIIENIDAGYGAVRALHGVSLTIESGQTVALLGTNGNGKSTLMKCVMGMVKPDQGSIRLEMDGVTHDLTKLSTEEIVNLGVALIPEGRRLFPKLTVEENLLTGAYTRSDSKADIQADLDMVYTYFPRLKERRKSQAGYTSGGEQQMCAIGRALMSQPETVLLDEPSMGLAPQLVEEIFQIVRNLNEKEGVTFLLAEQNTNVALRYAHYGYILESGRVVMDGPAAELRENPDVKEFYLGMSDEGRKSFRNVRSYRRRKRWLN